MSYLDVPRLHFFGSFFANPSTNNNQPGNYSLEMPLKPPDWNPDGSHTFMLGPPPPQGVELAPALKRFFPCTVTGIATKSGSGVVDAIRGSIVRCPNYGLLVDLDTDQQWVSQIIGNTLRIEQGADVIVGKLPTINFVDIFQRVPDAGGTYQGKDSKWSAAYQTVLTDIEWSDWPDSQFVKDLRAATTPGMLSIRFVMDGFNTKKESQLFRYGRLAGTIGPWHQGEPRTFVNARYLRPFEPPTQWGNFNYVPAQTDRKRKVITFDLGNAVPTTWPAGDGGTPATDFPTVVSFPGKVSAYIDYRADPIHLGDFDLSEDAYRKNAFVQEFRVMDIDLKELSRSPTMIMVHGVDPPRKVLRENTYGAYANFDQYVFRLNEGDTGDVDLWANQFEVPAADVEISLERGLLGTMDDGKRKPPEPPVRPNGVPPEAIQFPASITTDSLGHAQFRITAGNPGKPRPFIDGQVYGVLQKWNLDKEPNPLIGVSVKIFQTVPVPAAPTWTNDIYPILHQYAVLYPAMRIEGRIDLSDYDDVKKNIAAIRERIQLPMDNTGRMPITRELSRSKTEIILRWADQGCPK